MIEWMLDGKNWFVLACLLGAGAGVFQLIRLRRRHARHWPTAAAVMNLAFGLWIAIMGTGHTVAVVIEWFRGTLEPTTRLWVAIPVGVGLALPGYWLALEAGRLARELPAARMRSLLLNAWLGVILLATLAPFAFWPAANVALQLVWRLRSKNDSLIPASA